MCVLDVGIAILMGTRFRKIPLLLGHCLYGDFFQVHLFLELGLESQLEWSDDDTQHHYRLTVDMQLIEATESK